MAGQLEVLAVNRMVPISEGMAPPGSPQGGWECPGLHSHGPVSGWRSRAVLLGTGLWPWPGLFASELFLSPSRECEGQ